jgi:hypothetical protein
MTKPAAALLILSILLTLTVSAFAQDDIGPTPTPAPPPTRIIRVSLAPHPHLDNIDLAFEPVWDEIQIRQQQVHSLTGEFFQGLATDGTYDPGTPTDYGVTWGQFMPLSPMTYTLQIDTYAGPFGDGYSVLVSATADGAEWQRSIAYGLEPGRTWYWQPVPPEVAE